MVLLPAIRRRAAAAALRHILCSASQCRVFSSSTPGGGDQEDSGFPMLLRDFIHESLYHPVSLMARLFAAAQDCTSG
jgi:hypothetical protein